MTPTRLNRWEFIGIVADVVTGHQNPQHEERQRLATMLNGEIGNLLCEIDRLRALVPREQRYPEWHPERKRP